MISRWEIPVSLRNFLCLGIFEIIQGPKYRQPAIRVRRGEACEMGRIHHQNRMEFETNRPRLDISYAGQQQGSEDFPVTETFAYSMADFFEQTLARGLFQEANQFFGVRIEPNGFLVES